MGKYRLLQDQAYDRLREKALSGDFDKDQFYSEAKTASELSMSRTPVRDALLRLEQEGLIEIFPSRGYQLRKMTKDDASNLYQMRGAIEGYCSALLAKESETSQAELTLSQLRANLDVQMSIYEGTHDPDAFAEADYEFHQHIVRFSGNKEFERIFETNHRKITEYLKRFHYFQERMDITYKEHLSLYEILANGDPLDAFDYATMHIRASEFINVV
ncbi:MAG: GntR family transcriptional regulator [Clostridiales Family XIII bacterium]|nr:GntR family transcriptional regulator [Clostridiales Family XIII bacterium]